MIREGHSIAPDDTNESWVGALDEYGVQLLVLDRHGDSDLLKLFRSQPGWAVDFEGKEAVIFVRADVPQSANLAVESDLHI